MKQYVGLSFAIIMASFSAMPTHHMMHVVYQYTCIDLNAKVWKVFKPHRYIILCMQELTIAT